MSKSIKIKNVEIGAGRPKICAVVSGSTKEEILNLALRADSSCCDLIELRADYFEHITDIDRALDMAGGVKAMSKKPLIFTFRRKEEGGEKETGPEYYKELLVRIAANRYADIVDVEASAIEDDPGFIDKIKGLGARVILSKHDFNRTPGFSELMHDLCGMQKKGADIIKAAYMPETKKDVLNLVSATEKMAENPEGCPVIAVSMGRLGMVTRIIGESTGSAVTFAPLAKCQAPGQIGIDSLKTAIDIFSGNFKVIFLAGFMGVGKTLAANCFGSSYGFKTADLDAYIEEEEQMPVADIFELKSEEYFRDKETECLKRVLQEKFQVISLGGGAVLREENVRVMKEKGIIILLTASPEVIEKRLESDKSRPVLKVDFGIERIEALMETRKKAYLEAADMVIDTDNKTIDDICKEIVEKLSFNG